MTLLAVCLSVWLSSAEAPKLMAVTIDDLPAASTRSDLANHREITDGLLERIAKAGLPAIGFVNEKKLLTDGKLDPERVFLLERWLDAGLELGNHSYSHPSLHRVEPEAFKADVLKGEAVLRELLAARESEPRYFRHPFLHTGLDLETKQGVEEFLDRHGYRVAPVTIDNSEWIFARAYELAFADNDGETKQEVARAYVDYMEAKVAFFERQARQLFGRPIRHVLLLHANRLNADHLEALIGRLRSAGYAFVSLDEALEDDAYDSEDTYTGRGGISWIHRWALTREVDRSFFAGEPKTPAFVLKLAGIESE